MRLYFASIQRKEYLEFLLERGYKWVMFSFAYLQGRESLVEWALEQGFQLLIDSGAFTFIARVENLQQAREYPRELAAEVECLKLFGDEIEDRFREYVEFLKKFGPDLAGYIEMDLGGAEGKMAFRGRMEEVGLSPIPVFHAADDWAYGCGLMASYPYVAVGSAAAAAEADVIRRIQRILQEAKKHGCKIHVLGCTKDGILKKFPIYSVGSVTWAAGAMWGKVNVFRGNKLLHISDKRDRRRYKRQFDEALGGQDFRAFVDDSDQSLVTRFNLSQWAKYGRSLGKYWARKKPYWLPEEEHKIYDLLADCTCGQGDGSCARHGLGRGGADVGARVKGKEWTLERREKKALEKRGNKNAMVLGYEADVGFQLSCDSCYLADRCPRYEEGSICKCDAEFDALAELLNTSDPEAIRGFLWSKLRLDATRLARAYYFEAMDGGLLDRNVDSLSTRLTKDAVVMSKLVQGPGAERVVDRRQLQIRVEQLTETQFQRLLESATERRDEMPWLVDAQYTEILPDESAED